MQGSVKLVNDPNCPRALPDGYPQTLNTVDPAKNAEGEVYQFPSDAYPDPLGLKTPNVATSGCDTSLELVCDRICLADGVSQGSRTHLTELIREHSRQTHAKLKCSYPPLTSAGCLEIIPTPEVTARHSPRAAVSSAKLPYKIALSFRSTILQSCRLLPESEFEGGFLQFGRELNAGIPVTRPVAFPSKSATTMLVSTAETSPCTLNIAWRACAHFTELSSRRVQHKQPSQTEEA